MPVLKVKRGEKAALQAIPAHLRSAIIPLLEIVERKREKTVESHIDTAFADLATAVHAYPRCLLDVREIAPDGTSAAALVFRRAVKENILFTPVTGISRTADVAAALAHTNNGIAIRLTRDEFEAGRISRQLPGFMARHRLDPAQVDIIVDLGPVDDMIQDGVSALTAAFLVAVPDQTHWRTLTVSACAFPQSMTRVDRDSHLGVERNEWRVWQDDLYTNRQSLARLPTYSDCGIQHTKGVEGFDPRTMQVSAAIRYTLGRDWLLIKGSSTRTIPPSQQFPALAKRLVYGVLRNGFASAGHCPGCASMKAAADGARGFGSAEVWRRLGTIHHITTVAQTLAALP